MRWFIAILFSFLFSILPLSANEKRFTLSAPETLVQSGLLKHMIPRFSLKTGIKITLDHGNAGADLIMTHEPGPKAHAVFNGLSHVWYASISDGAEASGHAGRFLDWMTSEIGLRTITSYAPGGRPLFSPPKAARVEVAPVEISGDRDKGETLSLTHCGRCHVVSARNRMNAIGSTPSFAVLRTFDDWLDRFTGFYILKPHGAFTQIEDVTDPFSDQLPPAIVPVEMTLDDLEAILAFVATIEPADLGAPIQHQ